VDLAEQRRPDQQRQTLGWLPWLLVSDPANATHSNKYISELLHFLHQGSLVSDHKQ
jgi:hypothetical protein